MRELGTTHGPTGPAALPQHPIGGDRDAGGRGDWHGQSRARGDWHGQSRASVVVMARPWHRGGTAAARRQMHHPRPTRPHNGRGTNPNGLVRRGWQHASSYRAVLIVAIWQCTYERDGNSQGRAAVPGIGRTSGSTAMSAPQCEVGRAFEHATYRHSTPSAPYWRAGKVLWIKP